jgi:hypothetical protein
MINFNWTTELVAEMLNINGINTEIIVSFVNQKTLLPLNIKVNWFELRGEQYTMRGYTPSILLTEGVKILDCSVLNNQGNIDFRIGDVVYNAKAYNKYKGKLSNYCEVVHSIDLIKTNKGTKILINNFHNIFDFVKELAK